MSNRWNDVTKPTRRTMIRSITTTVALGSAVVGASDARQDAVVRQDDGENESGERIETLALEQNGQCAEITPVEGDEPIEEHYDYTYPQDQYQGQPGSDGDSYSSEGTADLQLDNGSILFFYRGPNGLSLVVVHGRVDGTHDGGTISFGLAGLPANGEWVVQDDNYLRHDGREASSNFDVWDVGGDDHVIHWAFRKGRTDGGAFRGFDEGAEFVIEPAFNDRAGLYDEYDFGEIERWEALSGSLDDPDRVELDMTQPVRITDGTCPE